jgi:dipeptidyl aminopeptidase/acylaminoacyl peptidase
MTRLSVAVVLAALLSPLPAPAQPKKTLLAVEDLYKFDGPRDTALSPDGQSAVFVRQWIDADTKQERMSLWRATGSRDKAAAAEPGEPDARAPVYSPDGKWVAFLSTRPRPDGWRQTPPAPPESDPATDIWLMPAAGGPAIPLAGPEKQHGRVFNDGFYGRVAFSPDSTRLAFIADDGTDPRTTTEKTNGVRMAREDQGEGYTGYGAAQLWVAYLDPTPGTFAAGRIDRLTGVNAESGLWYGDPQWSPDGTSLAIHANWTGDRESVRYSTNKNYDIWLIDAATGGGRRLTTGPGPEVCPRFSPDGTKIVCLSCPRKGTHRDEFNLMVIDLVHKESKPRVLFDHHDSTADATGFPRVMVPLPQDCWDGNGHLICTAEDGADNQLVRVSASTGRGEKYTPPAMVEGSPKTPGERMARRSQLTPPGNTFLSDRLIAPQKLVKWKSTDGLEIEGILTLPPEGTAKPPYKLLVHPHGGPHGRQTPGFDFTVQVFAANGYAVFQPNFRGSTGYGQKFIDADRGDFGGGDMRDIMTGVDKLIADGVADKDRLFVYGVSYGGFMTSWLVGQTDRFKAAAAQNAVTDLTMMWCLSDIQSWVEWEFGGRPWEVPEKLRKHSPLTYADKVTTPTLVLHAAGDRRCPLPMGKAFHQALAARGVPTGLVVYPGEGHGIRQPRHREDVLRRVLEWFARYEK